MASASASDMMPASDSMAAWAFEAVMSWTNRRMSKSMDALISSMISDGPASKRPPQTGLAAGGPFRPLPVMAPSRETWAPSRETGL